jgi:hypothetical protein
MSAGGAPAKTGSAGFPNSDKGPDSGNRSPTTYTSLRGEPQRRHLLLSER